MGTWGPGISSNDVYEDVHYEFFELYNEGLESGEITRKLIKSNQEIIGAYEDSNNFWFTIALCQWECKALDSDVLKKVTDIIDSGKDVDLWRELGAEKSELNKREKALRKFLEKLNSERKSPKRRKKKRYIDSIFDKGTCLSFKLDDGLYGAACVIESEKQTKYGLNLIAICDYLETRPPSMKQFETFNILISKVQESPTTFIDDAMISWYMAELYKPDELEIKKIGSLKVMKNYNPRFDYVSYTPWSSIKIRVEERPKLISLYGQTKREISLKSLIGLKTKKTILENMKPTLTLIVLLLIVGGKVFGQDEEDMICWSENMKITWDDFQGVADTTGIYKGTSAASVILWRSVNLPSEDHIPLINVEVCFIRKESWKVPGALVLINHEIFHFHIDELYARKARKEIYDLRSKNGIEANEYIEIIKQFMNNADSVSDRYDKETQHGTILSEQNKWEDEIYFNLELNAMILKRIK